MTSKFISKYIKRKVDLFDRFIEEKEKVLDIGAGAGWVAKELQKRKGARMTLLDVINLNQTDLPIFLYDGREMPFRENNFDVALLILTLHHCSSPLQVLKEAKRVTKDKIIIIEQDLPNFWLSRIVLYSQDIIVNLILCFFLKRFREVMNLPLHFKKTSEWERAFEDLGLQPIYKKEIPLLLRTKGVIFVARKRDLFNK